MPKTNPKPQTGARLLAIEYRPIDLLVPYANNPRQHPESQIKKLQRSLLRGWTNALLIDDAGNLICGHGRLEAARRNGYTTVPVVSLGQMSEAERRAYIIADNKLAEEGRWSKTCCAPSSPA